MGNQKEIEDKYEYRYFECACGGYGHPLKLSRFPQEGDKYPAEMYISLSARIWGSFWKRLAEAVRYVFRKQPWDYDDFTLLDRGVRDEIVEFLNRL